MRMVIFTTIALACLSAAGWARTYTDDDIEKMHKQIKELQADLLEQGRKTTALEIKLNDQQSKMALMQIEAAERDEKLKTHQEAIDGYAARKLRMRWAPGDWQPMSALIATAGCTTGELFVGLIYELSETPRNPPFVVTKIAPEGPAAGKMTWETEQPKGLVRVQAACARRD